MWIAIIQAIAGVVAVAVSEYPEVGWLVIVKATLDIALRLDTTTPIK